MKTDKTDIEIVKEKIADLIELWCILNTCKNDTSAWEIMKVISEVINKDALLKRWNELHPLKQDPTERMEKLPFSDDREYMAKRRKILERLLV